MKREDLLLVTPEKFKGFKPCWLKTREGCARFERIAAVKDEWNALDVLDLEDVSCYEKSWSVLREAFLPPMLLHEFGCRCAEYALSLVENPDARSVEAIRVKRRWMAGDATDEELRVAKIAALAAARDAERDAAQAAAWSAEWSAERSAEGAAAWAAEGAAARAARSAIAANETAAYEHEVEILRNLINEWEE